MFDNELKEYAALNSLAEQSGIVIFGGNDDKNIPLCELKQAFAIERNLYNRSISELSVSNAIAAYDTCVAPLDPETVLLHIGKADMVYFETNSADFDHKYRELIAHIKSRNPNCRVAIVSFQNDSNMTVVFDMNKHLRCIAESEQCEFGDISNKRGWNHRKTKDVTSFIYSMGFVRPLTNKRPIYELVKILF